MNKGSRQRLPGVQVDPEAIRRARLAAGLSLGEVAGEDLTRTAVHRIETGKVRPSMRTLEVIAERLQLPAERFFAAVPPSPEAESLWGLELSRLERAYQDGEYRDVVARVDELLPTLGQERVAARAHLIAGMALVQLLEPSPAMLHLREASASFEAQNDPWMATECLGWQAAALAIEESRTALDVALEALRRCRELDPVPATTESRILGHLAGIHLSMHDWERAVAAYRGALDASGSVRDLAGLTRLYDGLSIAYQGLGDLSTAATYAEKALTLSSMRANHLVLARIENNLGLLHLRSERWWEAERHLVRALEHCEEGAIEQGRSHVLLSLGQLAFAQGDHRRAEEAVRPAIDLSARLGETMTEALGHQWLARVLAAMGRHQESDRTFETAIRLLGELRIRRRLAECHRDYAEALQARDELRAAVEHWQKAAELWQTPVDAVTAFDWLDTGAIAN